jgi:hypothetical protein
VERQLVDIIEPMPMAIFANKFQQLTTEVSPATAPVTNAVPTKEVPSPKLNEPPKFHRILAPAPALIISN